MQGASLLELSNPDVAQGHTTPLAPLAHGLETGRDVPRSPIVDAAVRQGDEPDVFTMAVGHREPVKVTAGPDGSAESLDATFTDDQWIEADLKTIRVTCFRWDKPGG